MSTMDYPNEPTLLRGCDDLREWLIEKGLKCWPDYLHDGTNECNWYACRRITLKHRECECNEGKLRIVLKPYAFKVVGLSRSTVEVSIIGECKSLWFDLKAYSMTVPELMERLDDVEQMLVKAWNALMPG